MMENLPILCFKQLFNYLNIKEKIRCSLVCKKLRLAYDLLKPSDLCVYQKYFPLGKRSVLTNQTIEFKDALEADQFFNYEISENLFKNLKKLIIFGFRNAIYTHFGNCELSPMIYLIGSKNKFNYLNNFTNLVHLEICHSFEFFEKGNMEKLSLSKLKILVFKNCDSFYSELELDCPKLEILVTDMYKIQLKSHSIKFLDFNYDDNDSDIEIFNYGNKFENLEILILSEKIRKVKKNSEFLNDLPKLKLLMVLADSEKFKRKLELQNSKNSLVDIELKFFEQLRENILIGKDAVLRKTIDQPTNLNVKTFVENLSSKNFIECLTNLSKSPKIIKNSIDLFFNRSLRIESMNFNSAVDDYMILIKFFRKLGHLKYLILNSFDVFDQKFYDLLPDSLSIQHLSLRIERLYPNNIKLDFLSKLHGYSIDCDSPGPDDETFNNEVKIFYSFLKNFFSNNKLKHLNTYFWGTRYTFFWSLFKTDNFLILTFPDRSVKIIYKEIDQLLGEIERETDKNILKEMSDPNRVNRFDERTRSVLIQYLNSKGFKSSELNPFKGA